MLLSVPIACICFVKFIRSFAVCFMRFLRCFKQPKIMVYSVCFNMSLPFLTNSVPRNTLVARLVCYWPRQIFHILLAGGFTQVFPSIVRRISVNVINFVFGPFSHHYGPSHSMGFVVPVVNGDYNPSIAVNAPSNATDGGLLANSLFPKKPPGGRVISENFSNFFWRQHILKLQKFLALSTGGAFGKP